MKAFTPGTAKATAETQRRGENSFQNCPHRSIQENSYHRKVPIRQAFPPFSLRLSVSAVKETGFLAFVILHLVFLIAVSAIPLQAQDSRWKQLQSAGEDLFNQGRYAEAQGMFEGALAEGERFSTTDPRRLQSMSFLAMTYQQQGRLGQADSLYERLLSLLEKTAVPEDGFVAKVLNNL